jgi:hypothetical protein
MILFYLLLCWSSWSTDAHDFHVSRLTLDYQEDKHQFQVSLHVFTDDLELGLALAGYENLHLHTKNASSEAEKALISYLDRVLILSTPKGKNIPMEYLGKEQSDDLMASWVYFYWKLPAGVNSLHLNHRLLHDVYYDQQNIVQLKGCEPRGLHLTTDQKDELNIECPN